MASKRRVFLAGATALATTMVAGNSSAQGGPKGLGGKGWQRHAYGVPANTTNKCATCVFWGGERHVSRDNTMVHVQSLGMCNNPASGNYHTITSPDTGPMKAWVKWPALGA